VPGSVNAESRLPHNAMWLWQDMSGPVEEQEGVGRGGDWLVAWPTAEVASEVAHAIAASQARSPAGERGSSLISSSRNTLAIYVSAISKVPPVT